MTNSGIQGKPTNLRYVIRGAKRDTGKSISIAIDAPSATEAERQANDLGILVAEVAAEEPLQPAAATRPPTAQPVAPPKQKTNWPGLVGFILSFLGFATCGFLSPVAFAVSAVGMSNRPRGLSALGLILSGVGCVWLAGWITADLWRQPIDSTDRPLTKAGDPRLETPETTLEKAALVIMRYSDEHGELPLTKWGQHLITEWEEIRDEFGNHLRYKRLDEVQFEIRSVGSDLSDTDDDLIIIRPKPSEIADEDAREVAELRQAELDDRARWQREQQVEAARRQREQRGEAERQRREQVAKAEKIGRVKLVIVSWHWSESSAFAIAEGEVLNVSNESLRNVEAVVTFRAVDGTFITSDSALIEYNPILPGQTSPFSVMATWNPQMKKASLRFKELLGTALQTVTKEEYDEMKDK